MKQGSVLALAATLVSVSGSAAAIETRGDVETDHIEAGQEGPLRTLAVVLRPVPMATGWLGAEGDAVVGAHAMVSLTGEGRSGPRLRGDRVGVGAALFVTRSFEGFYVHPVFVWSRGTASGASGQAVGGGVTCGYAWAWPAGFTLRLGGGASYTHALLGAGVPPLEGVRPQVDADVGWVF